MSSDFDVLPFETDETDIHEGMGVRVEIVDLNQYKDESLFLSRTRTTITEEGQCRACGYDRGVRRSHTEVPGYVIRCRECERRLVENRGVDK